MPVTINGTTGIAGPDGSASTPAVQGTDSNTGLFYPAADTVALSTGGSERMRITSAGNVGIGVTPSAWSTFSTLQISSGSVAAVGTQTQLTQNAYWDGSNWKYINSSGASRYGQDTNGGATHYWYTAASGTAGNNLTWTESMRLTSNGTLILQGGSTSATGTGITFPATQSASSDANTLDDYEEGTWTPVLASFTGTSGRTLTGKYTKIGRLVYITVKISDGSQTLESTGNISNITGLPFTVSGVSAFAGITTNYFDTTNQGCGIYFNTTVIYTVTFSIAASRTIVISGTYEV